jgi:hypothetical protein
MPLADPPSDFGSLNRRVETDRFGPFLFQVGIEPAKIELLLLRVEDAHERFIASPLAQVANQLEREVVVSGVFGTNTIEGCTLTEDETASALALNPAQVQEVEQRRALNIKAAYDLPWKVAGTPDWSLSRDSSWNCTASSPRTSPTRTTAPAKSATTPWTASPTSSTTPTAAAEMGLIFLDTDNRPWPDFAQPANLKPPRNREA